MPAPFVEKLLKKANILKTLFVPIKSTLTFKRQINKMAKHTQTIRRQIADKLFECVWPFC